MANTSAYLAAEKWVRDIALPNRFGQRFDKRFLVVGKRSDGSFAEHEFDAVSRDATIVVSIKGLTVKTVAGRNPSGKIKDAFAELLFLSLGQASRRYLALTDPEFYELFEKQSDGKRPPGVDLMTITLPGSIQNFVEKAKKVASEEVSPLHRKRDVNADAPDLSP